MTKLSFTKLQSIKTHHLHYHRHQELNKAGHRQHSHIKTDHPHSTSEIQLSRGH